MVAAERTGASTRARILNVAQELFVQRGYSGTSIADIAGELGTSKAALYYHFSSKDKILGALVDEPISGYAGLADRCRSGEVGPKELLDGLIRLTVETQAVNALLSTDPSTTAVLRRLHDVEGNTQVFIHSLSGPNPTSDARTRAWAAFAVAKQATLWTVQEAGGTLTQATWDELLRSALKCLEA